jgi:membrane protein DedA with SNARE-associated domain
MLFAGFEVSDGRFTMIEIVAAGVLGNLVGSWIAYGIGYFGRVELLEKHGKWLHITPKHLAWADRWFERYGGYTVFFTRMMPVIRTFISLPAGVARMPFWKFTVLSFLGIVPWVVAFGVMGNAVGDRWDEWQKNLHYVDYAIVAGIGAGIVYLLWRRRRNRSRASSTALPDTTP